MIELVLKLAPVLLALVMLGMGLGMVPDDFARVVREPKAVAAGLFGQVICLPLLAWALVAVFPVEPAVAVGVLILAASPGGPGSNLFTLLAKGDAALSVTLTAVSSLLSMLTVPVMTGLATRTFLGASEQLSPGSLAKIAVGVCVLTVVPVAIGMFVRSRRPSVAERAMRPVRLGAFGVLLLFIVGVAVEQGHRLPELLGQAGAIDLALMFASMSTGAVLSVLAGLDLPQRRAIIIEVGIQNGALALVCTEVLGNTTMAVPVLVYSPVMLTAGMLMIAWGGVRTAAE